MLQDSITNQERLKNCYYSALGNKVAVEASNLLPNSFPNDGGYRTVYDDTITGVLLENLNLGDKSKKKKLGEQRIDLWFTFVKKVSGLSVLDSQ